MHPAERIFCRIKIRKQNWHTWDREKIGRAAFDPEEPIGPAELTRLPQLAGFARVNPLIFHISGLKGRHYKTDFALASIVLLGVHSANLRRRGKWLHRPIELAIRKGENRHYSPFRFLRSC